jgi:hypothetical protein
MKLFDSAKIEAINSNQISAMTPLRIDCDTDASNKLAKDDKLHQRPSIISKQTQDLDHHSHSPHANDAKVASHLHLKDVE